jgi:hypothetical protein
MARLRGSLLSTQARFGDWMQFVKDIVFGALGKRQSVSAQDARADRCCVYIEADIEHAVRRYGFERDDVVVVGNPDLVRFGLDRKSVGLQLHLSGLDRTDVMYIDTGLIFTGYVFESSAQFLQHILDTRDSLARQGRRLLFKPHPDHLRTELPARLAAAGIEVIANDDFVPRLHKCCASIVEPSSLSLVPALMGMPLLLAKYGRLGDQRFGAVLTSYPRALTLSDASQVNSLLRAERSGLDAESTRRWIDRHSGPLPAEEMPKRVVDVVERMVLERHQNLVQSSQSG